MAARKARPRHDACACKTLGAGTGCARAVCACLLADRLRPRGVLGAAAHLRDIAAQLFPPDWSYLSAIVAPLLATLRMSVTGTALGVALALGFAPLCAHNLPCPAPVRAVLRFLVQVLRSFPALILALLATFLFGLGTFSGTVAITVFTLAVMTRLTYEDIETLTLAPYRALCAMGASPARAYARAVVRRSHRAI